MNNASTKVLRAEGLVKTYGQRRVVDGVSLEVRQGEVVGLLGPNGAGKTTSFYTVVGLVRADEGHVFMNDLELTSMPMYKRGRLGIGYLPQEASIFRKLSVEDNILAILELQNLTKSEQQPALGKPDQRIRVGKSAEVSWRCAQWRRATANRNRTGTRYKSAIHSIG